MVLIGLFTLLLLIVGATPANAEPISLTILAAVGLPAIAGSTLAAVTTFVLTTALSFALSFVAQALFKAPSAGKAAATPTGFDSQPIGRNFNVRVPMGPRPVVYGKRRVGGTYALLHCTGQNQFLHAVVLLVGHKCNAITEVQIGEETIAVADLDADGFVTGDSRLAGMVRFKFHLGDANQAADQTLIDEIGDSSIWGPDHRLRGVTYMYVRFQFGPRGEQAPLFSEGIPNTTAVVEGKCDIYDPVSGTTGYSTNVALCIANYLCDTQYGIGAVYATAIDQDWLIASRNACNESVTKVEGGTEKRFEANGAFESSEQPQAVLGRLLASMHGEAPYVGGRFAIMAGVWNAPTVTLTEDDLRAGMTVGSITSQRDYFNAVAGTFTSPDHQWQEFGFPEVKSASAIASLGQTKYKNIALPFTTSASTAQRIAKIDLLQSLLPITLKMPCKLTAFRALAGGTVGVTYERWGWSNKAFKIKRARFVIEQGEEGPTIGIDLELNEIASTVYSWSSSEEQVLAEAPPTTLPSITNVISPANLVVTENLYVGRDGAGVKTSAVATWGASSDAFVTDYQLSYKLRSESAWNVQPRVAALAMTIYDLAPGTYDFTVAAVNYVGNVSPAIPFTAELTGLLAPPQAPQNMTLTAIGGGAYIRFDPTVDLDVQHGGWIVFRHSPAMTGATWDKASPLDKLEGRSTHAWLALKAGSYLARFLDSSGRYSVNTAVVVCKQASALTFTPASGGTLQEDSTFTGSKTNCSVSGGKLGLTVGQASGTYLWHAKMDLGSVKNVRLTVNQSTEVENATDTWDSAELCDSDEPWDAAVTGNEAYAITYVRETDDNPAGSPTWSEWRRIDSAEFNARGFDFKTELSAVDTNFVVKIPALAAVAEEVV